MTDSGLPASYRVEAGDLERDAHHIIALWSFNLGHAERRQVKFDWFYRHNPAGEPQVLLLKHAQSEQPIGTVGLGKRLLRCGPHWLQAGLMADFAVNTEHRTLFPALTLQRAVLEQGLADHDLLYGFPNAKSLPVVKRAGFECAGGMNRYVRVLRTQSYLTPRIPFAIRRGLGRLLDLALRLRHGLLPRLLRHEHLRSSWQDQPDARFDDLWSEQPSDDNLIIGVRNRAFLAWRFRALPWQRYRLFTVTQTTSDKLLGYAVCEFCGETLHVRDLLAANPASQHLPDLLRMLMRDARRQGFRSVSLEFMGPEPYLEAVRSAGMREREHLEQTFITAMPERTRSIIEGRSWYLTRADVDA